MSIFHIFKIRREERGLVLVLLLLFVGLQSLLISQHAHSYFLGAHGGFWTIFRRAFEVSGYDCWSWITVSGLRIHFDTMRHPLFFSLLYPLYWVNQGLMAVTGHNCAVVLVGGVLLFCTVYSGVFLFRILRELLGLRLVDSRLLVAFYFSFGHVALACIVPDHFVISMFLLLLTLYVCGRAICENRDVAAWKLGLLAFLTGGISLSNVVKTYVCALFVKGKRLFRLRQTLLIIVLPLALLAVIWQVNYTCFEVPQARDIQKIERNLEKKDPERVKKTREGGRKTRAKLNSNDLGDGEIAKWITLSTPRWGSLVENVFGESIQLHCDYALQDASKNRPVFVEYNTIVNYLIEAVVVLLFIVGLWQGRRNRLMRMVLGCFLFDVMLHFVLGFALNEVYIMSSGWIFVIPLAIGSLMATVKKEAVATALRCMLLFLTVFLVAYNGGVMVKYFM